jgi:DNA-binding XRE family transcriptional regulator
MPEVSTPSKVSLDSSEISSRAARKRVLASVSSTGFDCEEFARFWQDFSEPERHSRIPERTLVLGDLANIVRHFRSSDRHIWITSIRTTRPYFLAFVRTERDRQSASLIDDLMRHSDQRLTVCGHPSQRAELQSCIHEAFTALEPDSIADVRYSSSTDTFCIGFRDGLVGHLDLDALGVSDIRGRLVMESATVGEWGKTLELTTADGSLFEVDSFSVRALLDARFARKIEEEGRATNTFVGEVVKRARKAAGLTQAQLGEESGHDQAIISKLERGHHTPRIDTLRRIAAALGTDLSSLLA